MEKKDLSVYREKIDGIDKELVRLFAERMEVAFSGGRSCSAASGAT